MFSKKSTKGSIVNFSEQIEKIRNEIQTADGILIGAGAGLSAASGLAYSGERFERYFSDFRKKYGISDMYSGGFYPYATKEEYWAWWSRHVFYNRYEVAVGKPYSDLLRLVRDKDYFVLTTNVDHHFQRAGFDKRRLFYMQGDYGLFQCVHGCRNLTYDNEAAIREMVGKQSGMKIPTELIPKCPFCGEPMTMNLRCDDNFVQDAGWYCAYQRYEDYIEKHRKGHILLLELGVGMNTPAIIKYPFWQMTAKNRDAVYICVNNKDALCPKEISEQSLCVNEDIQRVLHMLYMAENRYFDTMNPH